MNEGRTDDNDGHCSAVTASETSDGERLRGLTTPQPVGHHSVDVYCTVGVPQLKQILSVLSFCLDSLSSYGRRAFAVATGPTAWNTLSDDLRDLTLNTDSFRRLPKTRLFSEYQYIQCRRPYNLYCVGADVKPCSINQSINQSYSALEVSHCMCYINSRLSLRLTCFNMNSEHSRKTRRSRS